MRALMLWGFLVATMGRTVETRQPAPSTFITMRGADTTLVEQFTRTATVITGDMRFVLPNKSRVKYAVFLHGDGTTDHVEFREESDNGAMTFNTTFAADSIRGTGTVGGRSMGGAVAATGNAYAYIGVSHALMETLIRATHPAVGDSVRIPVYNIRQNTAVTQLTIKRISADSVQIGTVWRLALSKSGDVLGGINTQSNAVTTRR